MRVVSLFDGMSCGRIALDQLGIPVTSYAACEIDKYAIKVSNANYPGIDRQGDVTKFDGRTQPPTDLLLGGSPCQGFSFAGKQLNFEDPRSKLFFEYVRILEELRVKNPDILFLMENVRMKKESQDIISKYLGVEPIAINSSLVSAQNRYRLYWTNIPGVGQPEDRGILLKDILQEDPGPEWTHSTKAVEYMKRVGSTGRQKWSYGFHSDTAKGKSACVTANFYKGVPNNMLVDRRKGLVYRKLTPIECERLQTVPDNYTNYVSNTQRYKMLGNGWTVEVIKHILKGVDLL